MNKNGFEIERKFLIAMPEQGLLTGAERSDIVQTYLLGAEGTTERVRARTFGDHTEYTHTTKKRISAMRRVELEDTIGRDAYEALLTRADPDRRPIEKSRFCLPFEGKTFEIDLFPFWEDRAYCEVELRSPEDRVELPAWLSVIREVTDDPRYTNSALAREIPADPI